MQDRLPNGMMSLDGGWAVAALLSRTDTSLSPRPSSPSPPLDEQADNTKDMALVVIHGNVQPPGSPHPATDFTLSPANNCVQQLFPVTQELSGGRLL